MRQKLFMIVLIALAAAGCQRATATKTHVAEGPPLPSFEAVDSSGRALTSDALAAGPAAVVFFDVESVFAWRALAQLEQAAARQTGRRVSVVGVGSFKSGEPAAGLDLDALRKEYGVNFPVVFDDKKQLSQLFDAQTCCDSVHLYDGGALVTSERLSQAHARLGEMLADLSAGHADGAQDAEARAAALGSTLKVAGRENTHEPLPVAARGLTIVNLFDDFCADCATGNRLQTLERLAQSQQTILAVFSEQNFSAQDLDNFKQMLPTRGTILRGDNEAARPFFNSARFLMVLDPERKVLWRERPGMSERDVFEGVRRVVEQQGK